MMRLTSNPTSPGCARPRLPDRAAGELSAHPFDDLGQPADVVLSGAEVDDAGAEEVGTVDHGVGDEDLAVTLEPLEQLLVDAVELLALDPLGPKAEGCDAQAAGARLQLGVSRTELVEEPCKPAVLSDRVDVAAPAGLAQCEPDFKRPEAARVLRSTLEVVHRLLIEVVVRRAVAERV